MKYSLSRIGALSAGLALVAASLTATPAVASTGWPPPAAPTTLDSNACAALVGAEIPASEFDLATTGAVITAANWVDTTGGQCRVNGDIRAVDPYASAIKFQVNLPKNWNERALQYGGGGLNGSLRNATDPYRYQPAGQPTPLEMGFVTLGSDGGHQGGSAEFAFNDEELMNYGKWAIKKTHDVAIALIDRAYDATPKFFYYQGFSTGGAEALDAASLYADDYDGVLAGTPAYNVQMMHLGWGLVVRDAIWDNNAAGFMNTAKQNLLVDSVYAACDPIDGLADGIISDTEGCLRAFDVQSLRCADGVDTGDTCLSDAQLAAIEKLSTPQDLGIDMSGNSVAAQQPYLNGGLLTRGRFNLGTNVQNPSGQAWGTGVSNSRYFVTKDVNTDFATFDPSQHVARIQELAQIMDVQIENFENSFQNDTKILLYTGLADDGISPYNTIQLYDRIVAKFGPQKVDSFLKFYTVPGLSHGTGPFVPSVPLLPAVMAWVEDGVEPGTLVAADANAATAGRERPICEYPTWPRFNGGDETKATSFSCVSGSGGIPVTATVDKEQGALALTVDDFGAGVELSGGDLAGDRIRFDGQLPGVTVTDSRNPDQAGDGGWAVTGQSSAFVNGAAEYGGNHLGWTPKLLAPKDGIAVGPSLATALSSGSGLGDPASLGKALPEGRYGQTGLGADLRLELPVDALSGTYSASLTLSLFPVD